jgi:hypothetical protein
MSEKKNDMSETSKKQKQSEIDKLEIRICIEATMFVTRELLDDVDAAPELENLVLLIESAMLKHREKYPNTKAKMLPLAVPFGEITL